MKKIKEILSHKIVLNNNTRKKYSKKQLESRTGKFTEDDMIIVHELAAKMGITSDSPKSVKEFKKLFCDNYESYNVLNKKDFIINTLPYYIMSHYVSDDIDYYINELKNEGYYSESIANFYYKNNEEINNGLLEKLPLLRCLFNK